MKQKFIDAGTISVFAKFFTMGAIKKKYREAYASYLKDMIEQVSCEMPEELEDMKAFVIGAGGALINMDNTGVIRKKYRSEFIDLMRETANLIEKPEELSEITIKAPNLEGVENND